jgi:hypothetical protein
VNETGCLLNSCLCLPLNVACTKEKPNVCHCTVTVLGLCVLIVACVWFSPSFWIRTIASAQLAWVLYWLTASAFSPILKMHMNSLLNQLSKYCKKLHFFLSPSIFPCKWKSPAVISYDSPMTTMYNIGTFHSFAEVVLWICILRPVFTPNHMHMSLIDTSLDIIPFKPCLYLVLTCTRCPDLVHILIVPHF